jgi:hypothetical protein
MHFPKPNIGKRVDAGEIMRWWIDSLLVRAICWAALIVFLGWAALYGNRRHKNGTYLFVTIKLYALEIAITAVFLAWLYAECIHQIRQLVIW